MGDFDVKPKGLDKLPVKDLKELAHEKVGGVENKTPPEVNYSWSDVMNILKHHLRRNLLIVMGKEKVTLSFWIETVTIILGILALSLAVLFPKLGIL